MRRYFSSRSSRAATLGRRRAAWLVGLHSYATGQGRVEYGLILAPIMVVCIAIVTLIGIQVSGVYDGEVVNQLP